MQHIFRHLIPQILIGTLDVKLYLFFIYFFLLFQRVALLPIPQSINMLSLHLLLIKIRFYFFPQLQINYPLLFWRMPEKLMFLNLYNCLFCQLLYQFIVLFVCVLGLEFRVERAGGMLLDQIMNIQLSLVSLYISLCLLQF